MTLEKRWQKWLTLAVFLGILGLFAYVGYQKLQPYMDYFTDYNRVRAWAASEGWKGKVLMVLALAAQVVVAVIPGGPMEIGAGYAYGPYLGTLLAIVGLMLGSSVVYFLSHIFGRRFVRLFVSEEKLENLYILHNPERLNRLIFIIFLIPGTPKDLLTYAVGLIRMPFLNWLVLTTLARTPATFVSTYAGEAILKQDYIQVAVIFVITMILSAIGYAVFNRLNDKRMIKKLHQEK